MNNLIKQIVESKFNFNIDLGNDIDSLSKSSFNSKSLKLAYEEYICVDLGLPSGTLWCKYNLGCNFDLLNNNPKLAKPEDWYGNYYAWGETTSKQDYSWETYAYGSDWNKLIKYCPISKSDYWNGSGDPDSLSELLPEDDVVRQNFGGDWCMPSADLLLELYELTNHKWIKNYKRFGVSGQVFRGNNQELFIPAAGYYDGSDLDDDGSDAYVWSLSLDLDSPGGAYFLYFTSFHIGEIDICSSTWCRYQGFSVRPVLLNK